MRDDQGIAYARDLESVDREVRTVLHHRQTIPPLTLRLTMDEYLRWTQQNLLDVLRILLVWLLPLQERGGRGGDW